MTQSVTFCDAQENTSDNHDNLHVHGVEPKIMVKIP